MLRTNQIMPVLHPHISQDRGLGSVLDLPIHVANVGPWQPQSCRPVVLQQNKWSPHPHLPKTICSRTSGLSRLQQSMWSPRLPYLVPPCYMQSTYAKEGRYATIISALASLTSQSLTKGMACHAVDSPHHKWSPRTVMAVVFGPPGP